MNVGTLRTAVDWANFSTNNNPANLTPNAPAPNTIDFDTKGDFQHAPDHHALAWVGQLDLSNTSVPAEIDGPGALMLTVSGDDHVSVFVVEAGGVSATIAGLTIAHGYAGFGGGITNLGVLAISGCTFSNNSANSGGGIYSDGTLTLINSTVANNAAIDGGGIYNASSGTLVAANCTLSLNSASASGGGIDDVGA